MVTNHLLNGMILQVGGSFLSLMERVRNEMGKRKRVDAGKEEMFFFVFWLSSSP